MTIETSASELTHCASLINASISNVFRDLAGVSAQVLSIWEQKCSGRTQPGPEDLNSLLPLIRQMLQSESLKFHGAGVVFAPGEVNGHKMHLEWLCRSKNEEIQPLTLNFNSRSERFYDYLHMPWYTRPLQTRQPSIVGPFVDLYGTEQYIVAFSLPIFFQGRFLGVAAADISLHCLEPLLVRGLMCVSNEALILNAEGRVLATNSSTWIAGDLIRGCGAQVSQAPILNLMDPSSYWSVVEHPVPRSF